MRALVALVLVLALVTPSVAARHRTLGRGEMAVWLDQAGSWEGTGVDAAGGFALHADLEALYGGKFVVIRVRETRADSAREELQVFHGGEAPKAFVYTPGTHRKLAASLDFDTPALAAGDESLRVTWTVTPEGLKGTREAAGPDGALTPVASWTLVRGGAALAESRTPVEYFEFMAGNLKGEGLVAIEPGQSATEHFTVRTTGTSLLNDTLCVLRERKEFDSGHFEEAIYFHYLAPNEIPVRHGFNSQGYVTEPSGIVPDIAQLRFFSEVPGGRLVTHVVGQCAGYKFVEELERPGQPAAWVSDHEVKK